MSSRVKAAPFKWVPTWLDTPEKFKERMNAHRRANNWPVVKEKADAGSNRDR